MGCAVYANGMSIACKAADGKTIAAMPDVCLSPPTPPAGPLPVPYPNTAMASDTTKGSKTVQIGGQEVMLKDQSTFKKSTGDEAATKTLGMGVVSHQIQGEVNFAAWSMDVKFEGENVPRHLDITLHNEMCIPANTPPWPYIDRMAMASGLKACAEETKAVDDNCEREGDNVKCPPTGDADYYDDASMESYARRIQNDKCQRAARCLLGPYDPSKCCAPQTPHHLVPKSSFFDPSFKAWNKGEAGARRKANCGTYDYKTAPCVCAEGGKHAATHGLLHDAQARDLAKLTPDEPYNFGKACDIAAKNMKEVFPNSGPPGQGCSEECTKAQLRRGGHKGITNDTPLNRKSEAPKNISNFRSSWKQTTRVAGSR
jgi:hypothetical protein